MINSLSVYLWREVLPRKKGIVVSGDFFLALIGGIASGYWGASFVPSTTTVGSLAIALLTYAAIALGFTLAGLTLVLTLPNESFVKLLCFSIPPKRNHDSYSDLLFIFSWTAVLHWLILLVSIGMLLFVNPQEPAFPFERHRVVSGLATGLTVYGLLQFLVTLITLAHVGATYIKHLRKLEKERLEKERLAKPLTVP